jgi:hypothetical protein
MFNKILTFIHKWEGGYVNHPADPGGATNRGITQRTYDKYREYKGLVRQDVFDMKPSEDAEIYRIWYWKDEWEKLGFPLAACMFDTAVNMGIGRAQLLLGKCEGDYVKFLQLRIARYKEIIEANPKLKAFEKGWMNRMTDLRRFIDAEKPKKEEDLWPWET